MKCKSMIANIIFSLERWKEFENCKETNRKDFIKRGLDFVMIDLKGQVNPVKVKEILDMEWYE
jgi:hypothetical protein